MALSVFSDFFISAISAAAVVRTKLCYMMGGLLGPHFFTFGEVWRDFKHPTPVISTGASSKEFSIQKPELLWWLFFLLKVLGVLHHIQSTIAVNRKLSRGWSFIVICFWFVCLSVVFLPSFLPFFPVSFLAQADGTAQPRDVVMVLWPCGTQGCTLRVSSLFRTFFQADFPAVLLFICQWKLLLNVCKKFLSSHLFCLWMSVWY